jgi:hypothetical protein
MDWTVLRYRTDEYRILYKGAFMFSADSEYEAKWLADLFNRLGTVPPKKGTNV